MNWETDQIILSAASRIDSFCESNRVSDFLYEDLRYYQSQMCWSACFMILSWVLNSRMWFSSFCLLCSLSVSVKRYEEENRWQQNHFLITVKNQSASAASFSSSLELSLNHISCYTDSVVQKWMYWFFCLFAWSYNRFQKLMFEFLSHSLSLWQMKKITKSVMKLCFDHDQNWSWRWA